MIASMTAWRADVRRADGLRRDLERIARQLAALDSQHIPTARVRTDIVRSIAELTRDIEYQQRLIKECQ